MHTYMLQPKLCHLSSSVQSFPNNVSWMQATSHPCPDAAAILTSKAIALLHVPCSPAAAAAAATAAAAAAALEDEPVLEEFDGGELSWSSVAWLGDLKALTHLTINVKDFECDEIFWRSMGRVKSLRDLHIRELHMSHFGGIVELTSCKQLTSLLTDSSEHFPDFEMKVCLLYRATPLLVTLWHCMHG